MSNDTDSKGGTGPARDGSPDEQRPTVPPFDPETTEVTNVPEELIAESVRGGGDDKRGEGGLHQMFTRDPSQIRAALPTEQEGDALLNMGGQLLTLRFGRADESEADLIGIDLAARAGYDPAAGVTLWQKMAKASQGAPPEFISTHPSGPTRIADIEANLPKVQPLYARADKPDRRFGPPAAGQN